MQKKYVKKGKRTTKNRRRTMLILVILIVGIIYLINNSKKQIDRIGHAGQALETGPIELDSIVQGFLDNDFIDGDYTVKVNGEQYKVEVVNYYEDVVYSLALGETSKTISLGDGTTEYKTLVVKYHGDLTIDESITVTASTVNNLTYKKGMYICVVGKLVNNGTITMTARGTYNCAGQNVYLWQNEDGTYEYVPALGATGGASQSTSGQGTVLNGKNGNNGANRQTGGGGTGGGRNWWKTVTIGAGGRGTSFSGGSGSGAANSDGRSGGVVVTAAGSSIGGPGSAGIVISSNTSGYAQISLGGTGNPTGGYASYRVSVQNYVKRSGTGGLLILFSNALINNGTISANGVTGSTATPSDAWKNSRVDPGGSSGGGSVNIFTRVSEKGNITANGGAAVQISSKSGAGGNGTVTINELEGTWMSYTDRYVLLSPGDTYTVDENKVLIFGDQIGKSLSYNIEDLSIATLESHGTIKAKAVGSTKLIITDKLSGKSTNVYIEVSNAATQTPNAPTLSAGMIPIKWDGNYWTITETTDTSWYDYASGTPAYIMLNDGVYQSELVRDMTNKKLAEKYVGYRINEEELGSIYMWVPRYAYSRLGKIQYIKQEYNVVGQWTMPEIFKYETESIDFSLAGVWVELKPLASSSAVTTKVNNMNIEENAYGFIANTVGIDVPKDPQSQDTIKKFVKGYKVLNNPIEEYENANRTILKIYDTTKKEPIKAKVTYSDGKVIVELMYFKYGINKVITENGTQLTKIDTNKYELSNLNDISYTYKIIDNEGNEKELSLDGIYIIPDAGTLSTFRDEVNAGNNFAGTTVIQTANIDMSSVCSSTVGSWTPIGATGTIFAGTYNGNYNTISNLYINSNKYVMLGFFSVANATIKNTIMENVYIYNSYVGDTYTSGLVSYNYGTIQNCGINSGTIEAYQTTKLSSAEYSYIGGICAVNLGSAYSAEYLASIESCYNKAIIKSTKNTSVTNAHVLIGGCVGVNQYAGKVKNCYNAGTIIADGGTLRKGGIIGYISHPNSLLENSYNYGKIEIGTGIYNYIGGIVGCNGFGSDTASAPATIQNSYYMKDTATFSCYYYSSGMNVDETGKREADTLKTYASKLGSAYKDDTYGINNGYPVLTWQEGGFLEKQKIMASAYYDETEEKVFVNISYTKHGISKVVTENGVKLTKVDTNKYELANLNDITTTYKVVDNVGNEKEVKLIGVYIIPNVQALSTFRDEVNAGNSFSGTTVIQTADIDMSSVCSSTLGSWIPIGTTENYFAGTYNGQNHSIYGIYINNTASTQGLFGQTNGATIKNVTVKEGSIKAGTRVGGIIGTAVNSNIENCKNYCTISSDSNDIGGIVGFVLYSGNSTIIKKCYNSGNITTATASVGGIVGALYESNKVTISECYNTGTITATQATTGGILGIATQYSAVTITDSYNTGKIIAVTDATAGGVMGAVANYSEAIIDNCYNIAEITAQTYSAGGVIGVVVEYSAVTIANSYNTAKVKAITNDNAGGVVGGLDGYSKITIDKCYNIGDVSAGYGNAAGICRTKHKFYC